MFIEYFPKRANCATFRATTGEARLLAELMRACGLAFPETPEQHIPSIATEQEALAIASLISHTSAETLMAVWADNRDLTTLTPADFVVWVYRWATFAMKSGGYTTYDTQQATWE